MSNIHVNTTVNGDEIGFLCDPRETLLDCLRDKLSLTGAKEGCGTGDCGACSVTLNDRLVCSCLVLGAETNGAQINTIEGMASGDNLHILQKKFLEHAALQCGICTPGILVAAKALLEKNPNDRVPLVALIYFDVNVSVSSTVEVNDGHKTWRVKFNEDYKKLRRKK